MTTQRVVTRTAVHGSTAQPTATPRLTKRCTAGYPSGSPMQLIETIDWLYRGNRASLTLITQMGDAATVLYGSNDFVESTSTAQLRNYLCVKFHFRALDSDRPAR